MIKKKKILIVAKNQFGYLTDYYYWTKYLLPEYDVHFIHYFENKEVFQLEGVKLYDIFRSGNLLLDIAKLIVKYLQISARERIDLTFIQYFKYCSVFRIFFWKKNVVDIRTAYISLNEKKRARENKFIGFEASMFPYITIINESLKKELRITKATCMIMPLGGMDFNIQGDHHELNLVYVGTLDSRRITDTVLGLSFTLNKMKLPVHYDIIGYGTSVEENKLLRTIRETNLEKVITFHGPVRHTDLKRFFARASIGIVYVPKIPAYDNQPPTKLFEFIINGIPVIATSTKEMSKYVNPQNGILVDDNPESFSTGLNYMLEHISDWKSKIVKTSLKSHSWEVLVEENLQKIITLYLRA